MPDFFIVGAPKAGTTALHAALTRQPGLFLCPVKEPKYCRPPRRWGTGPGDAHSYREWVWRRHDYEALFDAAPEGWLRGESTPFYLYDRQAQERIRAAAPHARLIAVLRDPVDRAYSNWVHLCSDGLEPIGDFAAAVRAGDRRVDEGWAPFWHYRRLGLYGLQLQHLYSFFPPSRCSSCATASSSTRRRRRWSGCRHSSVSRSIRPSTRHRRTYGPTSHPHHGPGCWPERSEPAQPWVPSVRRSCGGERDRCSAYSMRPGPHDPR